MAFSQKQWAMLCHLGAFAGFVFPFGNIIVPLVIWLLMRDQYPMVAQHGKDSLNFQLSFTLYAMISALLIIALIGGLLLLAIFVAYIYFTLKAALAVDKGEYFRYPWTIRFIK